MFNPMITPSTPPRRRMTLTLFLVWASWFVVNLAANGLFYIAAHGVPGLRLPAEILYYAGVSVTGVIVPYHISRQWRLDLSLFPKKRTVWFWLGSLLFLLVAVFLGIQAMADQGMALNEVLSRPLEWILAPLPIFIPTMIAYTLLWYGLMLRGWEKIFSSKRWGTALAVLLSALLYGVYHFASVDEIFTLQGMLDEILITTLIGIAFGIFVVLFRSLLIAFFVNWILNWFVFTPVNTFHPPVWQWPIAALVLLVVWLIYRYGWLENEN